MKQRVRDLIQTGDALFGARSSLMSLWQETAEQFYPERADFTLQRSLGRDFADNLMTGAPAMARRDLGNQFAAMLRPRGKDWFDLAVGDEKTNQDSGARAWLEDRAAVMRRAMYDTSARFIRATKEGDHDFAAFGQCVLTVEMNRALDGLLYRNWHLRDVVWCENAEGEIDTVHRNWKLSVRGLLTLFPKAKHAKYDHWLKNEPNKEIECRHIVMPKADYDFSDPDKAKRSEKADFVSIYVDKENDVVLEETPVFDHQYVIPRWQTVSGSQYAHSPATVIALPDSRLLQRITLTLLEAGEKAVNPPLIAVQEAIRSDIQIYAGGLTMVDAEYDDRTGAPLRPLDMGTKGGLAFGEKMADRYYEMIKSAFYLDKINLPPAGEAMTATEVRSRIEEYIRAALPLFEPLETEYNGALCEKTFNLMKRFGGLGPIEDMPPMLGGQEVKFVFQSPLQAAGEREKATAFQESAQLLAIAAQADPQAAMEIDIRGAFRDALGGIAPAKWIVPEEQSQQARQGAAQAAAMGQAAGAVQKGAEVATGVGAAAKSLQEAGLVPQAGAAAPIQGAPA